MSASTERRLRLAMNRLLRGQPRRSDGALTPSGLAKEAGVGRATVYRAPELLQEFNNEIDKLRISKNPSLTLQATITELQAEIEQLRKKHHAERLAFAESLNVMAQKIQILTTENESLRGPGTNVTQLRRPS